MRSAFIQIGDGHAFVDGIRSGHKCNFNGDVVYTAQSGKRIYWHTYKKWASYTSQMREQLIYELHHKIEDPILEMTTCCSICGSEFNPLWDIEF